MFRVGVALLAAAGVNLLLVALMERLLQFDWALPDAQPRSYAVVRWVDVVLPPGAPPAPIETRQPPPAPVQPPPLQPPLGRPKAPGARPSPPPLGPPSAGLPDLGALLSGLPSGLPAAGTAGAPPAPLAAPQPRLRLAPVYPPMARRLGIEGEVVVEFVITAEGRVRDARVVEARPARVFDQSALRAIAGWEFEPPTRAGTAVEQPARQKFRFTLQ